MEWLLFATALFVAFSNGANDNFKGFATVWGSATLDYRQALLLATLATVAGSLVSLLLAESLVQQFSGKGLVPDAVASTPSFIFGVAAGTAATVFLATRLGFPISTTHALIGGLIGAGMAQPAGVVHFEKLLSTFLLSLLLSPLLAATIGVLVYRLLLLRSPEKDCACVVFPESVSSPAADGASMAPIALPGVIIASDAECAVLNTPVRLSVTRGMDHLHLLSAASICFARGVNDTPKLTALLLAAHVLQLTASVAMVAAAMAVGGLLFARPVAVTMSQRVSRIDPTQGLSANLITALLVLAASKFGLPVSTTHVSIGSIAGVGASANTLDWTTLRNVLLSWVATLPLAAVAAWSVVRIG